MTKRACPHNAGRGATVFTTQSGGTPTSFHRPETTNLVWLVVWSPRQKTDHPYQTTERARSLSLTAASRGGPFLRTTTAGGLGVCPSPAQRQARTGAKARRRQACASASGAPGERSGAAARPGVADDDARPAPGRARGRAAVGQGSAWPRRLARAWHLVVAPTPASPHARGPVPIAIGVWSGTIRQKVLESRRHRGLAGGAAIRGGARRGRRVIRSGPAQPARCRGREVKC